MWVTKHFPMFLINVSFEETSDFKNTLTVHSFRFNKLKVDILIIPNTTNRIIFATQTGETQNGSRNSF